MDNNRKIVREKMEKVALAAKKNKYPVQLLDIILTICCSKEMHEKGITSKEALETAEKLILSMDKREDVLDELLKLSGYYDDL